MDTPRSMVRDERIEFKGHWETLGCASCPSHEHVLLGSGAVAAWRRYSRGMSDVVRRSRTLVPRLQEAELANRGARMRMPRAQSVTIQKATAWLVTNPFSRSRRAKYVAGMRTTS